MSDEQLSMLDDVKDKWREEWKDMPEYNMTREKPVRIIKINFRSEEDVKKFFELIGQKFHPNVENYWYPKFDKSLYTNEIYVDES